MEQSPAWNYERHQQREPGDFPHLDFESKPRVAVADSESSLDLPSPISTTKFYDILNTNKRALGKTSTPLKDSTNVRLNDFNSVADQLAKETQSHNETKMKLASLAEELDKLKSNYAQDREQWSKLTKMDDFSHRELEKLQKEFSLASNELNQVKEELFLVKEDRDDLNLKINDISQDRKIWLNKYDDLFSQHQECLKVKSDLQSQLNEKDKQILQLKKQIGNESEIRITEEQVGSKFNQLNLNRIDQLSMVEMGNILKNVCLVLNVDFTYLKSFIVFVRDDILKFFDKVHQIIHKTRTSSNVEQMDRDKLRSAMSIVLNDIENLYHNLG